MLIAFGFLQAAGAALLVPASLGLLLASRSPQHRQAALRLWAVVSVAATAFAPVAGDFLSVFNWRLVFIGEVMLSLATLAVGGICLPAVSVVGAERPAVGSVVSSAGAVALLSLGLVRGSDIAWSALSSAETAIGAALLGGLVLFSQRAARPSVPLRLLRSRRFSGALIAAFALSAASGTLLLSLLSLVSWEMEVWGWPDWVSGPATAPGILVATVVAVWVSGKLVARWGPAAVAATGLLLLGVGVAWWSVGVTSHPDYPIGLLGGLIVVGVGAGLAFPTVLVEACAFLRPKSFSTGSALVVMMSQIGLNVAFVGYVAALRLLGPHLPGLANFRRVWETTAALAFIASAVSFLSLRHKTVAKSA